MTRVFTIEGDERIAYDETAEEWTVNGAVEGRMAVPLARKLMAALGRYEVESDDDDDDVENELTMQTRMLEELP